MGRLVGDDLGFVQKVMREDGDQKYLGEKRFMGFLGRIMMYFLSFLTL